MTIELSDHPLVQHHLTTLRDARTEAPAFRRACSGMTQVLVAEAAKRLQVEAVRVKTPLEETEGGRLAGSVVFVPILRAGLGMLDHAMATIPGSSVGYIGRAAGGQHGVEDENMRTGIELRQWRVATTPKCRSSIPVRMFSSSTPCWPPAARPCSASTN